MAILSNLDDPSGRLISAENVQGTAVYDIAGERLGVMETVMLDKRSGRIAYAVLRFGGFLSLCNVYYPIPWQTLRYDSDRRGYVVDLDRQVLGDAPLYDAEDTVALEDEAFGRRIHDYYGAQPFWRSVI